MQNLKYIMLAASPATADTETPVLFPATIQHKAIAEALAYAFGWPIAAGSVNTAIVCYGESDSIKLASRGDEDTEILQSFI